MERYFSLGIMGAVAVLLVCGTFALLIVGRPIPEPIWIAWGVIITALFGHGTFLAQNVAHQRVIADLLDAVQTGVTAATPNTNGGNTTKTAMTEHV